MCDRLFCEISTRLRIRGKRALLQLLPPLILLLVLFSAPLYLSSSKTIVQGIRYQYQPPSRGLNNRDIDVNIVLLEKGVKITVNMEKQKKSAMLVCIKNLRPSIKMNKIK